MYKNSKEGHSTFLRPSPLRSDGTPFPIHPTIGAHSAFIHHRQNSATSSILLRLLVTAVELTEQ